MSQPDVRPFTASARAGFAIVVTSPVATAAVDVTPSAANSCRYTNLEALTPSEVPNLGAKTARWCFLTRPCGGPWIGPKYTALAQMRHPIPPARGWPGRNGDWQAVFV